MVHRFLVAALLVFTTHYGISQKFVNLKTYNVDSLLLILPGQQAEERVNSLNNLAVSLSFVDYQQSKQYADDAMHLANELKYDEGVAAAYRNNGHIHFSQGNYPSALNNYHEALILYEKLDKKHTAAWVCYDIAKTHYCARNFEKTVEYGNTALEIFHEPVERNLTVGTVKDTIRIIEGLALAYGNLGMFNKSIELYQQALEIGQLNNFGITEMLIMTLKIGTDFLLLGETDSAKVYFGKALAYPDLNPSIQALKYRPLAGLANFYFMAGEVDSAKYYKQIAFNWYNDQGYLFWALKVSNELGFIYYKNSELKMAENCFQESEKIFNEMVALNSWYRYDSLKYIVNFGIELFFPHPRRQLNEMMWTQAKSLYYNLYQINELIENTPKALKYHLAFFDAVDTLNRLQRNREIIELQTKYETERKEEQIVSLSQENAFQELKLKQSGYFLFGLGSLVVLIIILAIVLIRQNKLREQQKNLLLQQKLYRSQMNPHFIFNSLASIQNTIINEEPIKASKYLSRFSKLVRNILDSSVEEFITLEEEITTVENYLELQRIRFPEKFDYSIKLDEAIDPESIRIPPMLAQPFIENAIEHGIKHKDSRGNIQVRFNLDKNHIVLEVKDDGVGRVRAQEILNEQNKNHRSMATDITRERLTVLNKKLKQKISLIISDLKDDKDEPIGTKVVINIPYKQS
ncbi:MAG: histidine kinase [Bacteroidales bacterium]|nr:histidine kinase [Bacteroidales bacterium]